MTHSFHCPLSKPSNKASMRAALILVSLALLATVATCVPAEKVTRRTNNPLRFMQQSIRDAVGDPTKLDNCDKCKDLAQIRNWYNFQVVKPQTGANKKEAAQAQSTHRHNLRVRARDCMSALGLLGKVRNAQSGADVAG